MYIIEVYREIRPLQTTPLPYRMMWVGSILEAVKKTQVGKEMVVKMSKDQVVYSSIVVLVSISQLHVHERWKPRLLINSDWC